MRGTCHPGGGNIAMRSTVTALSEAGATVRRGVFKAEGVMGPDGVWWQAVAKTTMSVTPSRERNRMVSV